MIIVGIEIKRNGTKSTLKEMAAETKYTRNESTDNCNLGKEDCASEAESEEEFKPFLSVSK